MPFSASLKFLEARLAELEAEEAEIQRRIDLGDERLARAAAKRRRLYRVARELDVDENTTTEGVTTIELQIEAAKAHSSEMNNQVANYVSISDKRREIRRVICEIRAALDAFNATN